MSKIKKQLRKYMNEKLTHNDSYAQIVKSANLSKTEIVSLPKIQKGENMFMKKSPLTIILPCIVCLCFIACMAILAISLNNKKTDKSTPVAVVQMNLNPSVSFVVGDDGKVISVYGENDEGKMLICGETYTGLTLELAVEKIINEENKTGYLVQGKASDTKNEISFIIESSDDKIVANLDKVLKDTTTKVCEKIGTLVDINVLKEKGKAALVNRALELDPTLTEEVASEMSEEQLIKYIAGCQIEKVSIPTKELEELYNKVKVQKIEIAQNEEVNKVIKNLDSTYQIIIQKYDELLSGLQEANTSLDNLFVEYFVSENSTYQQVYSELKNAKKEVITLRNEIAQMDDSNILKPIKQAELTIKENALNAAEENLQYAKELAENMLNISKETINTILEQMNELRNNLPSEIQTELNQAIQRLDNNLNEIKEAAFKEFEDKYRDELENALNKVKDYKQELVEKLKK